MINPNIIAYTMYMVIMVYIIYGLGQFFHRKGRVFILALYHGNHQATDATNNLLLLAYYLFNIGYTFLRIRSWSPITNYIDLITTLSNQMAILILILSVTHYVNMGLIYLLSQRNKLILHHTNKML